MAPIFYLSLITASLPVLADLAMDRGMRRWQRLWTVVWLGATLGAFGATTAADAAAGDNSPAGARAYTCLNRASGASWQMLVDARRATVDAHPAKIGEGEISWFDPSDGSYNTLNRATGELTASIASSTGGYFRYAHCQPKTAR
jgi:hypothetical protein